MQLCNRINNNELKERLLRSEVKRVTLSFYRYAHIPEPEQFRDSFYVLLNAVGVFGRIYVAKEGINGQISVPAERFEDFKRALYSIDFLDGTRLNIAIDDDGKSFFKLKIKVREKIVADGLNDDTFDVTRRGQHLDAPAFNALSDEPGTLVVDLRNHYESEVGYFEDAIRPDVATFREALPVVEEMLAGQKDRKMVMYCTGGIRCEKASAYFLHRGFQNVFMVDGGIIEYSRQCQELGLRNKFIGKNFVFDERLGERISGEVVAHCHQCGAPCDAHVNCANDACHLLFIQCPACAEKYTGCCSTVCAEFAQLPESEQLELRKKRVFNGTKFSKGSHKAFREGMGLEMQ